MPYTNINLTEEEAIQLLELRGERLMKMNPNWGYMSVIKSPKNEDFHFSIGVYDVKSEVDSVNSSFKKITKVKNGHEGILPLVIGVTQKRLNKLAMNGSFPEVMVNVEIKDSSFCKDKNPFNDPKSGKCKNFFPRRMGHPLNGDKGVIGAIVESKDGHLYILTAYHVVGNTPMDSYPAPKVKVYSGGSFRSPREIGELFWYRYDDCFDIALIKVTDRNNVISGSACCDFPLEPIIGNPPKRGDIVHICSTHPRIGTRSEAKIISTSSLIGLNEGHNEVCKNLFQTCDLAVQGDSGSIVKNDRNEAVGLLTEDESTYKSYFTSIEILKSKLVSNVRGAKNEIFEFNRFL